MISFIPQITLTDTEVDLVNSALSQPVVKKYFMKLAWDMTQELLVNNMPRTGESAESFLAVQQSVHGRLGAIETLLQIQPAFGPSSN